MFEFHMYKNQLAEQFNLKSILINVYKQFLKTRVYYEKMCNFSYEMNRFDMTDYCDTTFSRSP